MPEGVNENVVGRGWTTRSSVRSSRDEARREGERTIVAPTPEPAGLWMSL
jgi:hypothetical protein